MKKGYSKHFTNIVIAGGALKTLSSIGCIKYLEEHGLTKHIKNFVGTSAGSIICLFLVLGYNTNEIYRFISEYLKRDEIITFDVEEVFMIFENYGLSSGSNLETFVSYMINNKLNVDDITFLDLAKHTGYNLVVCVSNLTKSQPEFWFVDTTPNMSVVKAVKTSCSIPLLFAPTIYEGNIYIDGGLYNNFPINFFKDVTLRDIIGINIKEITVNNVTNFNQYAALLFYAVINALQEKPKLDLHNNVITMEFEDKMWISINDLKITLSNDILDKYIQVGYDKIKNLFEIELQGV